MPSPLFFSFIFCSLHGTLKKVLFLHVSLQYSCLDLYNNGNSTNFHFHFHLFSFYMRHSVKRRHGSIYVFPLPTDFSRLDHKQRYYVSEVKTVFGKALVISEGFNWRKLKISYKWYLCYYCTNKPSCEKRYLKF